MTVRRFVGSGLILAFALFLVACQSSNSQSTTAPGQVIENTTGDYRFLVPPEIARAMGHTIAWQVPMGIDDIGEKGLRDIVIGKKLLVLQTEDNFLAGLHIGTGKRMWFAKLAVPGEETSVPVIYEDYTFLTSQSRLWWIPFEKDAKAVEIHMDLTTSTAPLMVAKDLAVLGSADGLVFWEDLKWGFSPRNRRYKMQGGIQNNPIKVESSIIVNDVAGGIACFNALSGELVWRKHLFDRITTVPAANTALIYIACQDQTLYALDRTSGRIAWKHLYEIPLKYDPYLIADRLYLYVPTKGMICFDAASGKQLWIADLIGKPIQQLKEEVLFWSADEKRIVVLNLKNGRRVREIILPTVDYVVTDNPIDGNLFMASREGTIIRLSPRKPLMLKDHQNKKADQP